MSELRPCPFCGGEAFLQNVDVDDVIGWCSRCWAKSPKRSTDAEAIAAWNTRATDAELDGLRAEVERLRKMMERQIKDTTTASYDDIRLANLREAATALYMAGRWRCDRPVDESLLWSNLRDALGLEPGRSPKELPSRQLAMEDLRFLLAEPKLGAFGMSALISTLRILLPETATIVESPRK